MRRTVCELSGGFDSAYSTLLTLSSGAQVIASFADYGQPYAAQELRAAEYLAEFFAARYQGFGGLRVRRLSLELGLARGGVPAAYVPIRNLVIGTVMANLAEAVGADEVVVGSKTVEQRPGDPFSFWDCTSEFYRRMGELVTACSEQGVVVKFSQPLVNPLIPKFELLQRLDDAGVDLSRLWNCYEAGDRPCMSCFHCSLMRADLAQAGLTKKYGAWWP